ncbi:glycosyl hydrolase [Agromyces sp. CFH 90414]|uniref:Glycosyl hydrolase n=1 Tax=Agromyces agglutinans TaxID=2662258 RepID=A0A6I2F2M9_9MICO|nr:glycosyl hydrolase [Agromyces agglutinans]
MAHADLIERMTLEEKASLMSGANFWNTKPIERLGVPSIMLTDGPHGVRKQGGKADHLGLNSSLPATCFPTAAALAQSWDPELLESVGRALGAEARAAGVAVLLGPGLNIVRNPLGGRSFEYFSEDPKLSGDLAAAMVRGIQSTGVSACPKHFAVNSQEHLRMSIDEVVDERSLREIYLEGFRRVVEDGAPKAIMTSYNRVNGTYANEHPHLVRDILRGEWGFDGLIVTDWGGNHDRVAGLVTGNQLEMPSSDGLTDAQLVRAVRAGELDEAVLDERVDELLRFVFAVQPALADAPGVAGSVDLDAQHRAAVAAARECLVLLKNTDAALPLPPRARVAVIGDFAATPRYQGAGSSLVNPTRVDDALTALRASDLEVTGYAQGFERFGGRNRRLRDEALRVAASADTVLAFIGLDESSEAEGVDREHLRLPQNQLDLVDALVAAGHRVVVVLAGGSPVELPFADDVAAILHTSLAGQGGGTAVADVLTGRHEPSGRLAVSYPLRFSDVPSAGTFPGLEATAEHRDAIFVGYRYYETRGVPVRYAFGHGLSYTSFAYEGLEVVRGDADGGAGGAGGAGGDGAAGRVVVRFTVRNTGSRAGVEVPQVYVGPGPSASSPWSSVFHARVQLAASTRLRLEPGEATSVELAIDPRALEYYSVAAGRWVRPAGEVVVEVGASVADIRLTGTITVDGETDVPVSDADRLPVYAAADVQHVDDASFATLLGRTPPPTRWDRSAPLTYEADTVAQLVYAKALGRAFHGLLAGARRVLLALKRPHAANNVMFLINMPFHKVDAFTKGRVNERTVRRFLRWTNRR